MANVSLWMSPDRPREEGPLLIEWRLRSDETRSEYSRRVLGMRD
jgi:hypothetical protein